MASEDKNTSGCRGVYWHAPSKSWMVRRKLGGAVAHYGYHRDYIEAERIALWVYAQPTLPERREVPSAV